MRAQLCVNASVWLNLHVGIIYGQIQVYAYTFIPGILERGCRRFLSPFGQAELKFPLTWA